MFTSLLLTAWIMVGEPAGPKSADFNAEIRRLVRQLDTDELSERDAAEQALIGKGPAVLELLPGEGQRVSAEVRERLARIRQKLQQLAVAEMWKPTLVTLHGDGLPLSKILAALEEQSGNKIVDYREQFGQTATDPTLKVDFDKTPFWQALDKVLGQAGMTIYPYSDRPGLNLVNRGADQAPHSKNIFYSGPFRFEPMLFVAQRNFDDPRAASLRLMYAAAWEPRLKPIILRQRMADVTAVDNRGQALAVQNPQAEMELPVEDLKSAVELNIPFALPPREVREIARLKGKLNALILGPSEEFRFGHARSRRVEDLLSVKNEEKQTAGVSVTLEQVRKSDNTWEIFIRVRYHEPYDALASHRGWIFRNAAYLEDNDGKQIAYQRQETTRQTKNEIGLMYVFRIDKRPADLEFIYKTPGAILNTEVEYEFHNLKLP